MSKPVPAPKADARASAQRQRILSAALQCFVEQGFHAASMASIAATADMSAGLIYRYFKGKNDIILAIIARQLQIARSKIGQLQGCLDLAGAITDSFNERCSGVEESMSAALFLEMSAQATRDPQIAAALAECDSTVRTEIASRLSRSRENGGYGLPEGVATARALLLQCLLEGLKVREAREPGLDRALLKAALRETVPALLAAPRAGAKAKA